MKQEHLSRKERRKLIYQFSITSKSKLIEIKTILERELSNRKHRKEQPTNEKKSIIRKFLSLFQRKRRPQN